MSSVWIPASVETGFLGGGVGHFGARSFGSVNAKTSSSDAVWALTSPECVVSLQVRNPAFGGTKTTGCVKIVDSS